MILLAFQQFRCFAHWVSGEYATGQIARLWLHMAALQLVGMDQAFRRSGGAAASRSSRRAACRASLAAFTLIALMPCSGLQAKLACVQAGARHAARACRLSPSLRLCPVPACKQSLHAFKPARGMPRELAGFHPHNRTLYPVQLRFLGLKTATDTGDAMLLT